MANKKGIPDFAKIKENVSFEDLLGRYNLLDKLKRKGYQLTGACPIHQGDGKSCFSVNLQKKCFNCFSCNAHGNILDFVAVMEKVEIKQAGELLSDWFNVPLQIKYVERKGLQGSTTKRDEALVRERKGGEIVGSEKTVVSGGVMESVESTEFINPPLTFELKRLNQEHPYLKARGLLPETIKHFGLGYCSRGLMKGRVVIPIHNELGELVAYAGRWVGNDSPEGEGKYKLPAKFQKSLVVFNLFRAREYIKEQGLILVEGYFSVFCLWQAGFPNVAALMGSSMSEKQEDLIIKAVGFDGKIILLFDNDEAGIACQEDVLTRLSKHCFVKVCSLPQGIRQVDEMEDKEIKNLFVV